MTRSPLPAVLAAAGLAFPVVRSHESVRPAADTIRHGPHPATLGEHATTVTVIETPPTWLIDLGACGCYGYDTLAGAISVHREAGSIELTRLALEGPVLALALAQQGIHVLHASAIALPDARAIALTAGSGTGKSTFAALAHARGWSRLADDLLPLTRKRAAWVARPHLEQPKLAADEQYPAHAPRDVPLAGIVELVRGPAARWDDYDAGTVTRLLLAGTVATRTYTAPMLAAHLDFCAAAGRAAAAGLLLTGRLTVPDRPDAIAAAIDDALAVLMGRITHAGSIPPLR